MRKILIVYQRTYELTCEVEDNADIDDILSEADATVALWADENTVVDEDYLTLYDITNDKDIRG